MRGTVAPHYIQTFRGLEATTHGRYYRRDVATVYERIDEVRDETPRQRSTAPKCRGYHYHVNCPELQEDAGRETPTGRIAVRCPTNYRRAPAISALQKTLQTTAVLLKVPTGG